MSVCALHLMLAELFVANPAGDANAQTLYLQVSLNDAQISLSTAHISALTVTPNAGGSSFTPASLAVQVLFR